MAERPVRLQLSRRKGFDLQALDAGRRLRSPPSERGRLRSEGDETVTMIRKCKHSKSGWNSGDLDVAFQLFSCGMVWDGNLVSKDSRDHLLRHGYAVKREGMQALTGKGTLAFLSSRAVWASAWRRWRLHRRNPFMADAAQVARAVK